MHLQGTAHTVHDADGEQRGWVCLDPYGQWRACRVVNEYMGEPHATREEAEQAVLDDAAPPKPKKKGKEAQK